MKTRIIVLAVLVLMSSSFADQKPCKEIFKKDKIEKGSRCIQWSFNPPNATNLILYQNGEENEFEQVLNGRDVATFALYFQWADEADVDYLFKGRMPWIPWF